MQTILKALFFLSFILIFTACGGSGHGAGSNTTADQNDYRLISESRALLSSDYTYGFVYTYKDSNITYAYDEKNRLIRRDTINSSGTLTSSSYTYNSDDSIASTQSENNASGTILTTTQTQYSDTQTITYYNLNTETEGFDAVVTTTTANARVVHLTLDGLWQLSNNRDHPLSTGYGYSYSSWEDVNESDGIIDSQISYEYDADGRIKNKNIDYNGDGIYDYNVSIAYNINGFQTYADDTDGNYESIQSTIVDNKLSVLIHDNNGSISTTKYTYTDSGKVATKNYQDSYGSETNTTYTYTASGEILTKTILENNQTDYSNYSYDENGRLIRFESTFEITDVYYSSHTHYLNVNTNSFSSDIDRFISEFDYDENDNLIKQTVYDNTNGIPTATVEYTWEKAE